MTNRYEIAALMAHGGWDAIGVFGARETAIRFAKALAESLHHDDAGIVVLRIVNNADSSHREEFVRLSRIAHGIHSVIDPLP